MDKIRFQIAKVDYSGTLVDTVDISVNGRNLIGILKEIELPYAQEEGHADIAGGYMGLNLREFKQVFVTGKSKIGEKYTILTCSGCGEPGCWDLRVKISHKGGKVTWSDFEQSHRPKWDYGGLEFVFDSEEYKTAVREMSG